MKTQACLKCSLFFQDSLPTNFWGACVLTSTHLINSTPSKLLEGKLTYEVLYHENPSCDHIKVFGTLCFAQSKKAKDKYASRGRKCIFIGYPLGQKGRRLSYLETQEFFVSQDVIF